MIRKNILLVLAVLVLVVTAGCTGIISDDSNSEPEVNGVEDVSDDVEAFDFPEGADVNGIDDTLAENHANTVSEATSITIEAHQEQSGETNFALSTVTVFGEEQVYQQRSSEFAGTEVWQDGSDILTKQSHDGAERYYFSERSIDRSMEANMRTISQFVANAEFKPVEVVEKNSEEAVKYEMVEFTGDASNITFGEDVSIETAELFVTSDGVITEFNFTTESGPDGERTEIVEEIDVVDVNETQVETPDWVSVADSAAVNMDAEYVNDGDYVALTMTNGEELEESSQIFVSTPSGEYQGALSSSVNTGDTLYLSVENGEIVADTTEPTVTGSFDEPDLFITIGDAQSGLTAYETSISGNN